MTEIASLECAELVTNSGNWKWKIRDEIVYITVTVGPSDPIKTHKQQKLFGNSMWWYLNVSRQMLYNIINFEI